MWIPLTDNEQKKLILTKLSQIADATLEFAQHPSPHNGLMDGRAGIGLFLFYYGRLTGEEKYTDGAADLFSDIFECIDEGFDDFRFSTGLAGISWSLLHLIRQGFVELEIDELLDDLDPFFYKAMTGQFKEDNYYDFLHGALGVGMYWLARWPHGNTPQYLSDCIDQLDAIWQIILDPDSNEKGVNLGTAHGLPSIIGFLTRSLGLRVPNNKIGRLLDEAVQYMLSHRLNPSQFHSVFPYSVRSDKPPSNSRLAWCYGDLGIGCILWQASQITGNKEWEKIAIDTLRHSTKRKELQANLVVDACFCHGTTGIMHIYNRMYGYTGQEVFREASGYWLDQTFKMAAYSNGAAGFKVMCGGDVWENRYNLLDGIAGMGMALMAALTESEPSWDRCFLLS